MTITIHVFPAYVSWLDWLPAIRLLISLTGCRINLVCKTWTIKMRNVVNTLIGISLHIVPISEDMLLLVTYQVAQLTTFTVSTDPLGWGLAISIYLACCYLVTTNLVVWLIAAWQLENLVGYRSEVGCNIPLEVLAADDVGTYLHLKT